MNHRKHPFWSFGLLWVGLQLGAQTPPAQVSAPPPVATETTANPEELVKARAIPYQTSLKRDPFATPSDIEQSSRGDLIDDIGVKGRVVSDGKVYAVVSDSRGNVRRLPIGHRFRDGEIIAVDERSVTFRQWDIQSTNRSVFRTVVKTFKREEGKR